MVTYFEKSPKPSIKTEMNQDNSQQLDYEELVAKTVRTETKVGLRLSFYI